MSRSVYVHHKEVTFAYASDNMVVYEDRPYHTWYWVFDDGHWIDSDTIAQYDCCVMDDYGNSVPV